MRVWAVIPAAGEGRRLRSLTGGSEKALLEVGGRSLIERLLEGLGDRITRVCIVVSHPDSELRRRLGSSFGGRRLVWRVQRSPLGAGQAVACAGDVVEGPFLLALADTYWEAGLAGFLDAWAASGSRGAVLVEDPPSVPRHPVGLVRVRAGRVTGVRKGVSPRPDELRIAGATVMDRSFFDTLPPSRPESGEASLEARMDRAVRAGLELRVVRHEGWRRNVNTPEDVARVRERIRRAGSLSGAGPRDRPADR